MNTAMLYQTARRSLERCIIDGRLIASPRRYSDHWARDTFWALRGMLRAGHKELARSSILLFLDYQRADGKIPRKLVREHTVLKYTAGVKIPHRRLRPAYRGVIPPFHSMDENALLVIAMGDYLAETNDLAFGKYHYQRIRQAIMWYENKRDQYGLVREYLLSNWMDSIFKSGAVLYTNVVYAHALSKMAAIAHDLGYPEDETVFAQKAREQQRIVRNAFWTGQYFSDTTHTPHRMSLAGNLLALRWNIADSQQHKKTLSSVRAARAAKLLPLTTPRYPFYRVNPLMYAVHAADYHNGVSWLWVDILYMMVEAERGDPARARAVEEEIMMIAQRDGEIGETYFPDGSVYDRRLWHSVTPFAWSSGMLLEFVGMQ